MASEPGMRAVSNAIVHRLSNAIVHSDAAKPVTKPEATTAEDAVRVDLPTSLPPANEGASVEGGVVTKRRVFEWLHNIWDSKLDENILVALAQVVVQLVISVFYILTGAFVLDLGISLYKYIKNKDVRPFLAPADAPKAANASKAVEPAQQMTGFPEDEALSHAQASRTLGLTAPAAVKAVESQLEKDKKALVTTTEEAVRSVHNVKSKSDELSSNKLKDPEDFVEAKESLGKARERLREAFAKAAVENGFLVMREVLEATITDQNARIMLGKGQKSDYTTVRALIVDGAEVNLKRAGLKGLGANGGLVEIGPRLFPVSSEMTQEIMERADNEVPKDLEKAITNLERRLANARYDVNGLTEDEVKAIKENLKLQYASTAGNANFQNMVNGAVVSILNDCGNDPSNATREIVEALANLAEARGPLHMDDEELFINQVTEKLAKLVAEKAAAEHAQKVAEVNKQVKDVLPKQLIELSNSERSLVNAMQELQLALIDQLAALGVKGVQDLQESARLAKAREIRNAKGTGVVLSADELAKTGEARQIAADKAIAEFNKQIADQRTSIRAIIASAKGFEIKVKSEPKGLQGYIAKLAAENAALRKRLIANIGEDGGMYDDALSGMHVEVQSSNAQKAPIVQEPEQALVRVAPAPDASASVVVAAPQADAAAQQKAQPGLLGGFFNKLKAGAKVVLNPLAKAAASVGEAFNHVANGDMARRLVQKGAIRPMPKSRPVPQLPAASPDASAVRPALRVASSLDKPD